MARSPRSIAAGGSKASYPAPGVVFGFPAWSPDGSRIAVVGVGIFDSAIYVFTVPPTGEVPQPPTIVYRSAASPPFYLYWTPDGGHLSFLTTEEVGIALRFAPVDGIPTAGGDAPSTVLREGAPLYFDWVDPTRVLVHVGSGIGAFVGELGLDGSAVDPATSPVIHGNGSFRPPVVSTDDRYVAYVTEASSSGASPDGRGEVVVAARDGTTDRRVPVFGPAALLFDPTGDTLATIGAVKASADIPSFPVGPLRLVDAASGSVRTLLDESVVGFFWSPDGRTIAALTVATPGQIPVARAPADDRDPSVATGTAPGGIRLIGTTVPRSADLAPAFSVGVDAGLVFVDVATGAIRSQRPVRLADHFIGQLLPYFDQYALSHRVWSPDGSAVLLPLVSSGKDELVVLPVDGSAPRRIGDGAKGFWSP